MVSRGQRHEADAHRIGRPARPRDGRAGRLRHMRLPTRTVTAWPSPSGTMKVTDVIWIAMA